MRAVRAGHLYTAVDGLAQPHGFGQSDALQHFAFWTLVATLKSAVVLLRLDPARAHVSLERLRQAMADQEQVEQ